MRYLNQTFARAFVSYLALTAGTVGMSSFMSGCKSAACTNTSLNTDDPSPAIECPSGDLCYRGSCIRACSAGQERAQTCTADTDCDSARPRCVDGFCSICGPSETCVPILNICQEIQDIPTPEIPDRPRPGAGRPPAPLDPRALDGGSYFEGGLTRNVDAGPMQTLLNQVTHAGMVDVAYEQDYRGVDRMVGSPVNTSRVRVVGYDVRNNGVGLDWRTDLTPPRIQCSDAPDIPDGCGARVDFSSGPCTISPLRTVTSSTGQPPVPADIGEILIDSHQDWPTGISQPITAIFSGNGYTLTPPQSAITGSIFTFSALPRDLRYLVVTGRPVMGLTPGAWPAGSNPAGHHVPYELKPSDAATWTLLTSRTIVASPPAQDLTFSWEPIRTGNDNAEPVVVRIEGADNELVCRAFEGSSGSFAMTLKAELLAEWRRREPAGVYRLNFERANSQTLLITPEMDLKLDVTVRVRHTLRGEIEFR